MVYSHLVYVCMELNAMTLADDIFKNVSIIFMLLKCVALVLPLLVQQISYPKALQICTPSCVERVYSSLVFRLLSI
ncbi:hypothetical protein EJ08DRAFT_647256 [Tothia fuscella]|uniref:Uncharacterized protein n=1 Tax=Tothia fuscella TaxID=1048955 RepID=A0A9P4NXN9_9PEZI|nr:hypothetical protein EJ08DRAFT_647256 [Tothia fuscella]